MASLSYASSFSPSVAKRDGPILDSATLSAYTKACQDVSGPKAHPRGKQVLDSLMKHLHAFAVEVELTNEEWLAACDLLIRSGKISDNKRNELILISDVLGLESLVDTIAHEKALRQTHTAGATDGAEESSKATVSAILGPFYRENAPEYPMSADIVLDHDQKSAEGERGRTCYLHGTVTSSKTGEPIRDAKIDVWHTGPNGLYEQQDPNQPDFNYRGKFTTGEDGRYSLRCLVPTAYPIPYDAGAGDILKVLDRSPMRPAHIHFLLQAPGYKKLVTQVFDRQCKYIGADAVFADKSELTVDFAEPTSKEALEYKVDRELSFDIRLVPEEE
ncbi:Catechol 1,2-dioxygenase [Thecaphora frezii]